LSHGGRRREGRHCGIDGRAEGTDAMDEISATNIRAITRTRLGTWTAAAIEELVRVILVSGVGVGGRGGEAALAGGEIGIGELPAVGYPTGIAVTFGPCCGAGLLLVGGTLGLTGLIDVVGFEIVVEIEVVAEFV